jgi:hypothetical protein
LRARVWAPYRGGTGHCREKLVLARLLPNLSCSGPLRAQLAYKPVQGGQRAKRQELQAQHRPLRLNRAHRLSLRYAGGSVSVWLDTQKTGCLLFRLFLTVSPVSTGAYTNPAVMGFAV